MSVWLWQADGPSSGGLGIAGDQGSAREAAEGRLLSGAATAAVVEEATAEIGIRTLTEGYERTGEAWQGRLDGGRVTWAPAARAQRRAAW